MEHLDQDVEQPSAATVALAAIHAVEERDLARLGQLYHPDVVFEWPPGLPYSGRHQGAEAITEMTVRFAGLWEPLQPTPDERRMDPVVVAETPETAVIEYTWRAVDGAGRRFETATLACYEVRDGRLAGARMFHRDHAGLLSFVAGAR